MAVINEFHQVPSNGPARSRTQVSCGHRTLDLLDGTRAVQLVTYGSEERKLTGKASQTIELDRRRAAELIDILRRAFPGL